MQNEKPANGLSAKRIAFVEHYMQTRSATEAATAAGYKTASAASLMAQGPIKAEIKRRLAALASDNKITPASLLAEIEEARTVAALDDNASAMVACIKLKAEMP